MKSFTTLLTFTAAAITVMAAPNTGTPITKELKGRELSEYPGLPDRECGVAIEVDLPLGESSSQVDMLGPPNYWCCDGYTGTYHSGTGKRVCCMAGETCCKVPAGGLWRIAGSFKSIKPVGTDVSKLMSGTNCGGKCQACNLIPVIDFPGYLSFKRNTC